ncbi:hypothetical protein [Frankia canadensis]|nr:hypothetical protein [Frankia canadensis]
MTPVMPVWRWGPLADCDGAAVWSVGGRRWGGVVAVPATMELFWARPVRIPPPRRYLARRVLGEDGARTAGRTEDGREDGPCDMTG